MAVHEITLGKSGTGKSYYVCYNLVNEWLPFAHNRNFFTNLPLRVDKIAQYFVENFPNHVSSAVVDRIKLFDSKVTESWLTEQSGPWDFFKDADLDAGRVVLDEVHNFVHPKSSPAYITKWRNWLGELRHCGATFEAISQYELKIHPLIRHEVGLRRVLSSSDDKRDPIFHISYRDHYQILSKWRGYFTSRIWVSEFTEDNLKWKQTGGGTIVIKPEYYQLYDSYSAPIAKGGLAAKLSPHPFGRMSWRELWLWYLAKNLHLFVFWGLFYALLFYLFCCNGIVTIIMSLLSQIRPHSLSSPSSQVTAATAVYEPQHHVESPAAKSDSKSSPRTSPAETKPDTPPPPPPPQPVLWTPRGVFDSDGNRMQTAPPKPGAIGLGVRDKDSAPVAVPAK
jgi:Zonular occludens toxin (Zot)